MENVFVADHPLIQHKVTLIRNEKTGSKQFRELIKEITELLCYEATRDLPLKDIEVTTPICTTNITQTTPVGYRFKDYLIVGGLLNVCSIITCTIVLYLVFFLGK